MTTRADEIRALRRYVLDSSLDAFSKGLLHVLIQYLAESGEAWPTVERLARESGMSERKAQQVLQALDAAGVLEISWSGGRRSHTYRFTVPGAGLGEFNSARRAPFNSAPGAGIVSINSARRAPQPRTEGAPTPHGVHPNERLITEGREAPTVWDVWTGIAGAKNRSLLAKLIKQHGAADVAMAVAATATARPADPVTYLLGVLRKRKPAPSDRQMTSAT